MVRVVGPKLRYLEDVWYSNWSCLQSQVWLLNVCEVLTGRHFKILGDIRCMHNVLKRDAHLGIQCHFDGTIISLEDYSFLAQFY